MSLLSLRQIAYRAGIQSKPFSPRNAAGVSTGDFGTGRVD